MQNAYRSIAVALVVGVMAAAHAQVPATLPSAPPTTQPAPRLGVVLMDLREYGYAKKEIEDLGGHLMVNGVLRDSRAERMGFRAGDVIKRVNGQDMSTVPEVIAVVRTEQVLEIEILRKGEPLTLKEASGEH